MVSPGVPRAPRIVSLLPGATAMVYALGLDDALLGVSHVCDQPPGRAPKPRVVRPSLPLEGLSPSEIDRVVSERLRDGKALYEIDRSLLHALRPELILTQGLCDVCAISGDELAPLVEGIKPRPELLEQNPHTLRGILDCLVELGERTGRAEKALELRGIAEKRLTAVRERTEGLPRRTAVVLEWIDPLYCSGHWTPEMVELAGGTDPLGRKGALSVRLGVEELRRSAADVLILAPCDVPIPEAVSQARAVLRPEALEGLPALRTREVYAVDAHRYLACPGPGVVEGTELLGHLLHPEAVEWNGPADAFLRVEL